MTPSQAKIRDWRLDGSLFVREVLRVKPDVWQEEFLAACSGPANPRRQVATKACTGPGKSAALAWEGLRRLTCFGDRGQHPKGAALSGEGRDNLKDGLWAELAKWRMRSPFLEHALEWNQERLFARDHSETWFLSARSYPKDANPEALGRSLSGLHSEYVFLLLDETGDMPVAIGQKASQIFTGGVIDGLIAAAGNPVSTSGLLYAIAMDADWVVITITADPDDPRRTPRVSIEHARNMIRKYGRDNPWVMATILGEFPSSGFNTLLTVDQVEAAMNRHIRQEHYEYAQKRIGVDVADSGSGETVLFPRQGLASFMPIAMRTQYGPDIAARVIAGKSRWGSEVEFFDDTGGWAGSAIDSMIQAGYSPTPVNFAGKAIDPRYFNRRAEMYFMAAENIKRGAALPKDRQLIAELTAPTYTIKNGKFLLEPKEKIIERIGRSPDRADSYVLTYALPEMPAATLNGVPLIRQSNVISDYNPFERM